MHPARVPCRLTKLRRLRLSYRIGSNNALVSVPGNVTVLAGQSSASFQATVGNVGSSQNAIVTASFNGVNQSATLSLNVPPVPTAVSVSPSASAGTTQVFTFIFSDSQSATNLSTFAILFAPSVAYPNSCLVVFDQNRGTVQLEWDNVSGADAKPCQFHSYSAKQSVYDRRNHRHGFSPVGHYYDGRHLQERV